MGSRTRSHIIEDESRAQFRMLVPSEWVVRDKANDYGIDCEVEIFDKLGNSTGHVFWVQLKATDAKDKKSQQSISIRKTKVIQLTEYPIPVLFIRYCSDGKLFYVKWAKTIALFHSNNPNKHIRIEFRDTDRWHEKSPNNILNYLINANSVRRGEYNLPVNTFIESDENNLAATRFFGLRSTLCEHNDLIKVTRDPNEAYLFIYASDTRVILSLMDQYGASFGFGEKGRSEFEREKVSNLVLLGMLIIFAQQNRYDFFNLVLEKIDLNLAIKEIPELLQFLLPHLFRSGNLEKNLSFIMNYIEESGDAVIDALTNTHLLFLISGGDSVKLKAVLNFFEKRLIASQLKGNNRTIATDLYNLGNIHKELGDYLSAIIYLNRARKEYNEYLKRDYFLKELGGIFFLAGKYKRSAFYYSEALKIDDSNSIIYACYGDALLFCGSYADALIQYDRYITKAGASDNFINEVHLKYSCLRTLFEHDYPSEQKRKPQQAIELASNQHALESEEYKHQLLQVLELDLLCSFAWYNLGIIHAAKENYINSFICFVMSALINGKDINAWINASVMCLNDNNNILLLNDVVNTAFHYCGEEYLDVLVNHLSEKKLPATNELIRLIDNLIKKQAKRPVELRIHGEDSEFATISF